MNDRALWITWYDLGQYGREDYLAWLHQSHIPGLLARPGYLWAAHYATQPRGQLIHTGHATINAEVPGGTQFILMIGAETTAVFGDPTQAALQAALPESSRTMLRMRSAARTSVMVEAARVNGEALRDHALGMVPASCIQLGSFNYPWQHEQELLAWFTQWRMPVLQSKFACVRIRKLVSVMGWAKHGVLYEWTDLDARNREYPAHEDNFPEMRAWSQKVIARIEHAPPGSGSLATRIWPPVQAR